MGVKCSKAITRSEITRGFRVSENLHLVKEVMVENKKIAVLSIDCILVKST